MQQPIHMHDIGLHMWQSHAHHGIQPIHATCNLLMLLDFLPSFSYSYFLQLQQLASYISSYTYLWKADKLSVILYVAILVLLKQLL